MLTTRLALPPPTAEEVLARRQSFIADLACRALSGCARDELLTRACDGLAELLHTPFITIVQQDTDGSFQVTAGCGWAPSVLGRLLPAGATSSMAGFTAATNMPVLVEDLRREKRFATGTLVDFGVASGVSAPIRVRERVFGVLGAHARQPEAFAEADTSLVLDVANIIGAALASSMLQEQLRQSQRFETLGRVAASIVHDLNNMLGVIACTAGELEETIAAPAQRALAGEVSQVAHHAGRFLKSLLAFARHDPHALVPIALNTVLTELLPLLKRIVGRACPIELVPTTLDTWVLVDRTDLEQIVLNLVVNARDAMPSGGPISIASWVAGDGVVLSVADRGVGMDAATRNKIFDPFFTTKGDHGNGLGLAIVQALVARANAAVAVTSAPGYGSTFEVTFPRIDPP